jgi:hypothetical protein
MPQCISARLVYVLLIHSYTRTDLYVITKQKTLGPRGKWWKGRKIAEGRESKGVSSSESVLKVTYGNVEGGKKFSACNGLSSQQAVTQYLLYWLSLQFRFNKDEHFKT